MSKKIENEEIEELEEELEEIEEVKDIADALTDAELDKKISSIVDEKIQLAQTAEDDEDDEELEDEEEEKSIGLFPFILVGGVVLVGIATFLVKNSPDTVPTSSEASSHE